MATGFIFLLLVPLPLVAGIVLIILSRKRSKGYPACGQCGYNVTGSIGNAVRCPECGSDFAHVGITPAVSRRNNAVLLLGVALIAVPLTCVGIGVLIARLEAQQQQRQAVMAATPILMIPPPLSQAQVNAMNQSQAQQALAAVSRARAYASDAVTSQRLKNEFNMLMQRLRETSTEGSGDAAPEYPTEPASQPQVEIPPPLTPEQINAMTIAEVQDELARISGGRRVPNNLELKQRLKAEFPLLIARLHELKPAETVVASQPH